MSDFLTRLAERTLGLASPVQPILASRYEPGHDLAAGGVEPPAAPAFETGVEVEAGAVAAPAGRPAAILGDGAAEPLVPPAPRGFFPRTGGASPAVTASAPEAEPPSRRERAAPMSRREDVGAGGSDGTSDAELEPAGPPAGGAVADGGPALGGVDRRSPARPTNFTEESISRESGRDVRGAALIVGGAESPSRSDAAVASAASGDAVVSSTAALPVVAPTSDIDPSPALSVGRASRRDGDRPPARRARGGAKAEHVGGDPGQDSYDDEDGGSSAATRSAPLLDVLSPNVGQEDRRAGVDPAGHRGDGRDATAGRPARLPAAEVGAPGRPALEGGGLVAAPAAPGRPASQHDARSPWADQAALRETGSLAEQARPIVQVTIGRIEVRAVPPPPAPPATSTPVGPRVALDDYLRERNGGRR